MIGGARFLPFLGSLLLISSTTLLPMAKAWVTIGANRQSLSSASPRHAAAQESSLSTANDWRRSPYNCFSPKNTRRITSLHSSATPQAETSHQTNNDYSYWTIEQLHEYAVEQGVSLTFKTLGPGFRAVARDTHNTSQVLGYVEGFVRPNQILQLDQMKVFSQAPTTTTESSTQQQQQSNLLKGGPWLGVGLLVAYECLWHFREACPTAEMLAIHDEEFQHQRLVKLYRLAGFHVVKYVGDDWTSIPDRLIWGGCGTLLSSEKQNNNKGSKQQNKPDDANSITDLLVLWTKLLEKNRAKSS